MFLVTVSDPLKEDDIDMGDLDKEKVLDIIIRFPWQEMLDRMKGENEANVYSSPTIEIENPVARQILEISAATEEEGSGFFIWYSRYIPVKKVFGIFGPSEKVFVSSREQQTQNDVLDAARAFLNGDQVTMEKRWG